MSSRSKPGPPARAALDMRTHCPSTVQTKCSLLWLNGASLLVPSLPLPPVAIYSCRASAAKSLAYFVASIESFILKLAMPTDSMPSIEIWRNAAAKFTSVCWVCREGNNPTLFSPEPSPMSSYRDPAWCVDTYQNVAKQ